MWNDDSGDWQGLGSENERPRYKEIARIVTDFCSGGSVLDVGCGEAILATYLPNSVTYSGVEPSAKAARIASDRVSCQHSTAEDFAPNEERWDCIIFNEMLYYSRDPKALLVKFSKLLRPNGIILISIYQKRDSWRDRIRFSMTNSRCTRIVKAFIARERWTVERDQKIDQQQNRDPWWLLVTRPS